MNQLYLHYRLPHNKGMERRGGRVSRKIVRNAKISDTGKGTIIEAGAESTMKKNGTGRTRKLFGICGYIVLSAVIAAFILFILFGNSDIGTGLLERTIAHVLSSAGIESGMDAIYGNPWKGYEIEGLALDAPGVLSVRIGRLTLEPDIKGLLEWKPVKKIGVYDSVLKIEDPSGLGTIRPRSSGKGRIPLPPLPIEIRNLSLSASGHTADIESADLYHSSGRTDISMTGSADGLPFRAGSVLDTTEGLTLPELSVHMGRGGHVVLSGDLFPSLDISGSATGIDMAELGAQYGRIHGSRGMFSAAFRAAGTIAEPEISGDFAIEEAGFGKSSAGSVSGTWSFSGNTLAVRDIGGDLLGEDFAANLSVDTSGLVNLKARGRDLDLDRIAGSDPRIPPVTGEIDSFALELEGKFPAINGRVDVKSRQFALSGRAFDSMAARISFRGGTADVDSSLKWNGTAARIEGKADFIGKTVGLSVMAPKADLNTLAASVPSFPFPDIEGAADLRVRIDGPIDKPEMEGTFSSALFSIKGEQFRNTDLSFTVNGDSMHMDKFASSGLGGTIEGGGTISGLYGNPRMDIKLRGRHLDLSRASSLLGPAPEGLEGTIDVDVSVGGTPNEPTFRISSPLVTAGNVVLQDLDADFAWKAPAMDIRNISVSLLDGRFSASGNITAGPPSSVDLKGSFSGLDLENLPFKVLPPMEGTADGEFTAIGPASDPDISFTAEAPLLSSDYASLHDIRLYGRASRKKIDIAAFDMGVGDGLLKGSASIRLGKGTPDIYFSISGSGLETSDLLTGYLPSPDSIGGNVDILFNGHSDGRTLEGDGDIFSSNLSIAGLPLEKADIPVEMASGRINVGEMKIDILGGSLSGDLTFDIKDLAWNGDFHVRSADIAKAAAVFPALAGKLQGTALLDLHIRGRGVNKYGIFGYGLLEIRDGSVGGFPAVKAAAATAGKEKIEFKRAKSNFMTDGLGITLFGGSRIEAPLKYPIYRNIGLDGTFRYDGGLDINGEAEVNMQALNAFTGAVQVALDTALAKGDLVQNLLNELKGIGRRDFRTVSFEIGGSRSAPEVKKLDIEGGREYLGKLLDMEDADKDKTYDDDRQIYIRLEFPVGPGGGNKGDTAGEQLRQQLIDGLLDSLFPKQ